MKVYIVLPYYDHEGCLSPVAAFVDKSEAEDYKKELTQWYHDRPCYPDLPDEDDEGWNEADKIMSSWRELYPDASPYADGFIIQEVELK